MCTFIKYPNNPCGAYGEIFSGDNNKVTKIFFNRSDATSEHIESVFNSEIQAYLIAKENPEIQSLVPLFYGKITVLKVLDTNGVDITKKYRTDLAYQMEKIDGDFVKGKSLPNDITNLFRTHGIGFTSDSSFTEKDNKVVKIVDFATEYHEYVRKPAEDTCHIDD